MTPQDPGTPSHPTPEYYPSDQSSRRQRSGLAVALLALLVVGAVVLGVWIYTALLRDDSSRDESVAASSTAPPTVTSTAAPTTSQAPVTVTVTETPTPTPTPEETPEEETPAAETPAETPEETPPPPPAEAGYRAPASAEQCAANVNWRIFRANDQTSCGFAESVAVQMAPYTGLPGSALIYATSPVTGQEYEMRCIGQGGNSFVCEGGNNAVVILEDRSVRD
jgi:type IV secretory pathway VirB10-like protein